MRKEWKQVSQKQETVQFQVFKRRWLRRKQTRFSNERRQEFEFGGYFKERNRLLKRSKQQQLRWKHPPIRVMLRKEWERDPNPWGLQLLFTEKPSPFRVQVCL